MAWLDVNRPARDQWYSRRTRPLTGCTVLHTSESIWDSVGSDTGAENVARFIQTRSTPGSYHDLVDADSGINLVDYNHGAYHDGTGSNNWALSLSFACRTSDWARMSAATRAGFLRQGALRFVAQQKYRKAVGAPLTRLRLISKAQSDAGESGFTYHGLRDPGRRSDPGVSMPNRFPLEAWLEACAVALGEQMPDHPDARRSAPIEPAQQEEHVKVIVSPNRPHALVGAGFFKRLNDEQAAVEQGLWGKARELNDRQWDIHRHNALSGETVDQSPPAA